MTFKFVPVDSKWLCICFSCAAFKEAAFRRTEREKAFEFNGWLCEAVGIKWRRWGSWREKWRTGSSSQPRALPSRKVAVCPKESQQPNVTTPWHWHACWTCSSSHRKYDLWQNICLNNAERFPSLEAPVNIKYPSRLLCSGHFQLKIKALLVDRNYGSSFIYFMDTEDITQGVAYTFCVESSISEFTLSRTASRINCSLLCTMAFLFLWGRCLAASSRGLEAILIPSQNRFSFWSNGCLRR